MKKKNTTNTLSKRERQIMDIIYKRGNASVNDVLKDLPDPPTYSSIRGILNILVNKGYLKTKQKGLKYIYTPVIAKDSAAKNALNNLINTYFNNSVEDTVSALINLKKDGIDKDEYQKLIKIINKSKDK
ncbi:MAG: BlaI/MecI/CopY family transcriptional regulator [Spirochaetes bacterium]|nr:BlaI/MecI/CopY family transcriptional regulator [Spirochaetota bacterium]